MSPYRMTTTMAAVADRCGGCATIMAAKRNEIHRYIYMYI